MTPIELSMAAGLMEGEGTVRINTPTRRNQGHLAVSMTNTNVEILNWMNERWPGYMKPVTGMRPNQRPAWCWTIAARRALAFLDEIEPYVITARMRERIATARWWQELKSVQWQRRTDAHAEESFNSYHYMRELNRRGVT